MYIPIEHQQSGEVHWSGPVLFNILDFDVSKS